MFLLLCNILVMFVYANFDSTLVRIGSITSSVLASQLRDDDNTQKSGFCLVNWGGSNGIQHRRGKYPNGDQ